MGQRCYRVDYVVTDYVFNKKNVNCAHIQGKRSFFVLWSALRLFVLLI